MSRPPERPRAYTGPFPCPGHRTLAEVDAAAADTHRAARPLVADLVGLVDCILPEIEHEAAQRRHAGNGEDGTAFEAWAICARETLQRYGTGAAA